MSEANKALASKAWKGISAGDVDKALAPNASDVTYHTTDGDFSGREAVKEYLSVCFNAFSNINMTVEDMLAEGDKVVSRVTVTATHTGEPQGMPPTGKQINVSGMSIMRIANGEIAEEWEIFDLMSMMQQLGAIPSE